MKQIHAYFSGHVQGVFFRSKTKAMAQKLSLTGFVKNLPDSRVELLAQGEEENINKLLDKLNQTFTIKDSQISFSKSTHKFSSFTIEYK